MHRYTLSITQAHGWPFICTDRCWPFPLLHSSFFIYILCLTQRAFSTHSLGLSISYTLFQGHKTIPDALVILQMALCFYIPLTHEFWTEMRWGIWPLLKKQLALQPPLQQLLTRPSQELFHKFLSRDWWTQTNVKVVLGMWLGNCCSRSASLFPELRIAVLCFYWGSEDSHKEAASLVGWDFLTCTTFMTWLYHFSHSYQFGI